MNLYNAANKWRAALPVWLWNCIRKPANALLGPLNFSLASGHFLSCFKSRAVDKSGEPLPWLTYPIIEFLSRKDLNRCSVIEFGSGQSTYWLMHRVSRLVSFENDATWHDEVKQYAGTYAFVDYLTDDQPCPSSLGSADIVLVDGCGRLKRAQEATKLLKPGGAIIVDNTDWHPEIKEVLAAAGFSCVDFWGYPPGCHAQGCTSLYFLDYCFLFTGKPI